MEANVLISSLSGSTTGPYLMCALRRGDAGMWLKRLLDGSSLQKMDGRVESSGWELND